MRMTFQEVCWAISFYIQKACFIYYKLKANVSPNRQAADIAGRKLRAHRTDFDTVKTAKEADTLKYSAVRLCVADSTGSQAYG